MNIFLSILAFASCSFYGIYKSSQLHKRNICLEQIGLMLEQMIVYIKYDNMKTKEIIKILSEDNELKSLSYLNSCKKHLYNGESFRLSWEKSIDESKDTMPLSSRDIRMLKMLSSSIGSLDVVAQVNAINTVMTICTEQKSYSVKEFQEKSKLYNSLGVLSGIAIALLIW